MAWVEVEVDLDSFSDDEILEAALEILQGAVKGEKLSPLGKRIEALFLRENGDVGPISAAALVHSAEDLRAWREGTWEDPRIKRRN